MQRLTVSPAYGRDYKSAKAALADWADDKDFVIESVGRDQGRFINRADAEQYGATVNIRYAKLTRVVPAP